MFIQIFCKCNYLFIILTKIYEKDFFYFFNFFYLHFNYLYIFAAIIQNLKIMAYKILDNCVACGTCIDECPVGAISEGDIYVIDPDTCVGCGSCAGACPNDAIVED